MQHRTIEADVLEVKDKLVVLKSDEADWEDVRAISDSFKKHGNQNVMVMCIGSNDSIETMSKERAIEMLNYILKAEDE
mgnify:CR=1 FL=1